MNGSPARLSWVLRVAQVWAMITLALLAVALAWNVAMFSRNVADIGLRLDDLVALVVRVLLLLAGTVGVGLVYSVVYTLVSGSEAIQASSDRLSRVESVMDALLESNRRLVDLAQMSDAAKSLIFRQREIQAMNEQLHESLMRQDYPAAEALAAEAEKRPSYAEQAQAMRREIVAARTTTIEQKIDSALARVKDLIAEHDWPRATEQAHRLLQLTPDNPKVKALPEQIREARAAHKRQLLQEYDSAVSGNQLDRSIELLQELDKYLTPQEGDALRESARGVFKAKLASLGVQFSIRVTEGKWTEAVEIGEQIVRDYPNSRMAQEVRDKMDVLRLRASAQQAPPPATGK